MQRILFATKNPGKLGVPLWLAIVMVVAFSIPLFALPFIRLSDIYETPLLILIYPAAFFPLSLLYLLRRLMTRYALRVHEDGSLDVIYPFTAIHIPRERLQELFFETHFIAAVDGNRTWIRFVDSKAQSIEGGGQFFRFLLDLSYGRIILPRARELTPSVIHMLTITATT